MNISVKNALIITFAFTLPFASSASHAQDSLTVRCASLHLPTQQAVGRALGLSNFGQTYSAREKLIRYVNHACLGGVEQVTFVNEPMERAQLNGSPRVADKTDSSTPDAAR